MLASYNIDMTTNELQSFPESLPSEVESLYERLLHKLPPSGIGEAALLLHILTESKGPQDRSPLYRAWDFTRINLLGAARSGRAGIDYEAYDSRLRILLGNLVDVTREVDFRLDLIFVRLVPKSLSAYLFCLNWIADNFPEVIARRLGGSEPRFLDRVDIDVVNTAAAQHAIDPKSRLHKIRPFRLATLVGSAFVRSSNN